MISRVLHIYHSSLFNGVEELLMNYYRHIDRTRLQFDFLIPCAHREIIKSRHEEEIQSLGGHLFYIPSRIRHHFTFVKQLNQLFAHTQYTAVHIHPSPGNETLARIVCATAKKYAVPMRICHAHSTLISAKDVLARLYDLYIRLFFPTNITHYAACSKNAGEVNFKNCIFSIVKNAIDLQKFNFNPQKRQLKRQELNLSESDICIGHIGRFDHNKNQSFLIDILTALHAQKVNVKLILAGDGDTWRFIENKVKENNLSKFVIFIKEQCDPSSFYNAIDCFILPSILEGLGIVNIEAQACGVPCLMSDAVPPEAKILEQSAILPLSAGASVWAAKVNDILQRPIDKDAAVKQVKDAGWDIKDAAQKLQNLYLAEGF